MKFLADMGISPNTVAFLQGLGYDAVHLTHDLDFGGLVAASGAKLPSVIIFRLRNMRPEQVNRYLQGIITQHQTALEEGAIISVTEGHIRVRVLPVKARE